jgi:cyclic pyranopterin phosphate synthase
MKDLQDEREMLFGFTQEETSAWQQQGSSLDSSHVDDMNQARQEHHQPVKVEEPVITETVILEEEQQPFTHVSDDGAEVSMVDVGHKAVTQRVARAQTKVVFPPEVMSAFDMSVNNELVGPKGPIFATAKLAGIMAAKKTSDLIPLCHPLALDKVHVEISLQGNVALIECECRVTSKTGVEMEALTGATVTALTVYDMVKAVSHRVQITETVLLSKSGGKRTIGPV